MADDSSAASSDNEEQQVPTTIADDIVVTKYKMAAEITNRKYSLFENSFNKLQLLNVLYFVKRRVEGSRREVCRWRINSSSLRV
jgi:hypothetical protein